MIGTLLFVILLIGVASLTVAIGALRSSRRSEELGEDRYELLRDQHDRLELLREERQVLVEELERESRERQRFMDDARPHVADVPDEELKRLKEELEQERQAREETARRAEQQEQERQRLEEEHRLLEEELERERQAHAEARRIIAGLVERIPAIEAPAEQPERDVDEPEGASPRPDQPGAQEGVRRPWWRRVFGS